MVGTLNYLIVDLNRSFVNECVKIGLNAIQGDIMTVPGVLVSPANSFGFMDGGIDAVYSQAYPEVARSIYERLNGADEELVVGKAIINVIPEPAIHQAMIVAPTMRTPATPLNGTMSCYLATLAAANCYRRYVMADWPLLFPGMGTGSGGLDFLIAARQMAEGLSGVKRFPTWRETKRHEDWLAGRNGV